jgi:hypothetical protein
MTLATELARQGAIIESHAENLCGIKKTLENLGSGQTEIKVALEKYKSSNRLMALAITAANTLVTSLVLLATGKDPTAVLAYVTELLSS